MKKRRKRVGRGADGATRKTSNGVHRGPVVGLIGELAGAGVGLSQLVRGVRRTGGLQVDTRLRGVSGVVAADVMPLG